MTNDMLKLFETEEDIKAYAKVNGYDAGGIAKLIDRWHSLEDELDDEPEEIENSVKNTMLLSEDMQQK